MPRTLLLAALAALLPACRTAREDTVVYVPEEKPTPTVARPAPEPVETGERAPAWSDAVFLHRAAEIGAFEVDAARLAVERASVGPVREFAARIIEEGTVSNRELLTITRRLGVEASETPGEQRQKVLEELRRLEGPPFDRAYLQSQVAVHDEAIPWFERATREAEDREIRDAAAKALTALKKSRVDLLELEPGKTKPSP